jgi:hypothetical protein
MNYDQLTDLLNLVRGGFIERATNMIEQELVKPEMPTKIFGPNLEKILNAAGFYRSDAVCCGDYKKCIKPCTPRGRWLAEQEVVKFEEPKLLPVCIGVDVTPEGTHVVAVYRRSDALEEMFYSQFHPLAKRKWVGLTEKESFQIAINAGAMDAEWLDFIKLVEQELKEKNNG